MLSYILDVYWGDLSPGSIVEFLHYVLFFSTIIAGPIERMPTFRGQATTPFSADQIESGLQRIIRGAAKKTILSDVVCAFVLGLPFANPDLPGGEADYLDAVRAFSDVMYGRKIGRASCRERV